MFLNPSKSVAQFGLREGMRVAEFGSGVGFYARELSKRVGHTGKVYAIEIQKDLLKKMEHDMKSWELQNISCIWGDIEKVGGTKIADHSMDRVVIVNVLFQVHDKLGLIDEAKRILKRDGKIILIDWIESYNNVGPRAIEVVSPQMAEDLFTKRGFTYEESIAVSPYHYGILFLHE